MNLRELLDHTRRDVLRDVSKPYLWSDALLTTFLNEAQDTFARRTHCLPDATSDFTFITTETGVAVYELDSRIVFIAEIIHSDGRPLIDRMRSRISKRVANGVPTVYSLDGSLRTMRIYPAPDAEYTLDMLVARKPLQKMQIDTDTPELDGEYHTALCDFAAWRALRNNDPDGSRMAEADNFRAAWDLAVRDAKRDVVRLRAGANPCVTQNWTHNRG